MEWTEIPFGKYKGKTLPQVVFADPDWFFHQYENRAREFQGMLTEVEDVYRKARNIKIRKDGDANLVAEYVIDPKTRKFCNLDIRPRNDPLHEGSSPAYRKDVIDLSFPRKCAHYDKLGAEMILSAFKYHVLGDKRIRLTKSLCEAFFSDNSNFVI